jgi:hypothetical protein
VQGRWSLTATLYAAPRPDGTPRTQAELLLERYGIVTREQVLAEGIAGGFSSLYDQFAALETLGVCRRGYFIEGLGGAQFALPGAVERLRAQRDDDAAPPVVLAATDPAQVYGGVLKWPDTGPDGPRLARQSGAYVVLAGAEPVLYVERGGKSLHVLAEPGDERIPAALEALAEASAAGACPRSSASSASTASRSSARRWSPCCSSSASARAPASSPSPPDGPGHGGPPRGVYTTMGGSDTSTRPTAWTMSAAAARSPALSRRPSGSPRSSPPRSAPRWPAGPRSDRRHGHEHGDPDRGPDLLARAEEPEATPASPPCAPLVTTEASGTKASPRPRPHTTRAGSRAPE